MPNKYIPYVPEPIDGQAVLQNFNRILKYKGSDDIFTNMNRGMPLYEVERKEIVGSGSNENLIIRGECVSTCAYLKANGITVDLVYIDPPFASGADYAKKVYVRRNPKIVQTINSIEQEVDSEELRAFEEKMYGDVWDKEKYLNWMYENLTAIKSVMSENASIYVHLDYHIGHYVKILMDEIFGEDNFINEIIWQRTNAHNMKSKGYVRSNETIYLYSLSENFIFNEHYTGYSEAQLSRYKKDENGRYYTGQDLTFTGTSPNRQFEWRGAKPAPGRVWGSSYEELEKLWAEGRILTRKDGVPRLDGFKVYLDEKPGNPLTCTWSDIERVGNTSEERLDYATQKPEALLERIIEVSSDAGMVVADFFGGSGVTAAVANKLGRKFIHCDIGINSIQTTRDRLISTNARFDVMEIKDGVQLYRNPIQTMDKLKNLIPGLKNEDSLDSFWEGVITDSKLGPIPVYIPNLMDSSTKLLDKVLMNRIIHQAIPELNNNVRKVIVYYVDITDENEIRKFISENDSTTVEIELRDLKVLLEDIVVEDYVDYSVKDNDEDLLGGYIISINKFISDRVIGKISEFNEKNILNSKKGFKPITISDDGLEMIEFISIDSTASEGEWHSDSEIKIDKLGYISINGIKSKQYWDGTIKVDNKPLRIKIRNICGDETIFMTT